MVPSSESSANSPNRLASGFRGGKSSRPPPPPLPAFDFQPHQVNVLVEGLSAPPPSHLLCSVHSSLHSPRPAPPPPHPSVMTAVAEECDPLSHLSRLEKACRRAPGPPGASRFLLLSSLSVSDVAPSHYPTAFCTDPCLRGREARWPPQGPVWGAERKSRGHGPHLGAPLGPRC